MTLSHSSKDPLRPPVSGGQLAGAVFSVVTDSPSETGGVSRRGEGVDGFPFPFIKAEGVDGFPLSRFSQILFYHLHLPWCEHSLVLSVTHSFEGLEEAAGEAQFLAEEVDGSLVRQMRIVEQGKAAEVVYVNRRLPHNRP